MFARINFSCRTCHQTVSNSISCNANAPRCNECYHWEISGFDLVVCKLEKFTADKNTLRNRHFKHCDINKQASA